MTNRDKLEEEGGLVSRRRTVPGSDSAFTSTPANTPDTAMRLKKSGEIIVGGYKMTPRGLIISPDATKDNWDSIGKAILGLEGALQWIIGDWLNDGDTKWGETVEKVATDTGRDRDTLYNYTYVASKVPFSLRNENLTFNHHYAVAKKDKDPDEQARWLTLAAERGWSVAKLRAEMEAEDARKNPHPTPKSDSRRISRVARKLDTFERAITSDLNGVGRKERQPIIEKLELLLKRIRNGEI